MLSFDAGVRLARVCIRLVLRHSFQLQRGARYAPSLVHSGYDADSFEHLLRLASDAIEDRDFLGARDYIAAGLDVLLEEEKQPQHLVASLEDLMVFLEGLAQGHVDADRGLAAWFRETHWWRSKNSLGVPYGSGVEKFIWVHWIGSVIMFGIGVIVPVAMMGWNAFFPALGLFLLYAAVFASVGFARVTFIRVCVLLCELGMLWWMWGMFSGEGQYYRLSMCFGMGVGGLACAGILYAKVFRNSNSFGTMGRIWVRQIERKKLFEVVVENEFFEVVDRFTITKFKAFFEPIISFTLTSDLTIETVMNGDLCDDSWFQVYPALIANRVRSWGRNLVPKDWKDSYETSQGIDKVDFEKYFSTLDVSLIPPGVESSPRQAYSAYVEDPKPKRK
ncbi:hypothetical protein JOD55_001310 [Arcanobacterium pluranimalium]|uniref:hypothetical protein n=1 Tax=Arcanobacterium pluranimalium TaxID=108028 RepID=UPI00195DBFEA|nr:hypothetical protein [Arcanobacterium pluranimalium]MBM7825483.1 hypothetical protein [Arcanobacterium pluranimalium]